MMSSGLAFQMNGLGVGGIVLGEEPIDGRLKIDDGMEDAVLEPPAGQLCEEALDGVEPRTRGRREVEGPARVAGEPGVDFVHLVRRVIVEDHMDGLVRRDIALDAVEEANELLMAVSLHVLAHDGAIQHIKRGEQCGRSVPLVVVGHRAGSRPFLSGSPRLVAIKRLDLALFIDRQHHRVGRRRDVQSDDVGQFVDEVRIGGKL